MTIENYMVVSMEPDGTDPNVSFHMGKTDAHERAIRVARDMNRDVFVSTVTDTHYASRQTWRPHMPSHPPFYRQSKHPSWIDRIKALVDFLNPF